jgi:PAS domain S-box-containing protein
LTFHRGSKGVTAMRKSPVQPKSGDIQQLHTLLFETANDAIFFMKREQFIDCNQKTLKMFRCTRKQIVGHTPFEFSPPIQPDGVESKKKGLKLLEAAYRGKPQFFEWKHLRKDGAFFDAEVSLNSFTLENEKYIQAIVRDVSYRKKAEREIEERLKFETLITELSAQLINLSSEEVDREIKKALKKIVEFFGRGYCVIIQATASGGNYEFTHVYASRGMKPIPLHLNLGRQFTYAASLLLQGKVFQFSSLDDFPEEAAAIKNYYKERGIKTWIAVPMKIAGNVMGALSIAIYDSEKTWSAEIVQRIQLLGEILASTLKRKQSDDALKTMEERNRLLIENVPAVIWVTDRQGNTAFISANVKEVYGYSADEIYANPDLFLKEIHPDDVKRVSKAFKQLFTQNKNYEIEYRIRRKDGEWIWLSDIASITRKIGKNKFAFGVFYDITDRKLAEEALRESEMRFRAFSMASFEGIAITHQGKLIDSNIRFAEMLGYSHEELNGTPVSDLVAPEDRKLVKKRIKSGFEKPYTHRALRKDGRVIDVEVCGKPVQYLGLPCRITALRDITHYRRTEAALRDSLNEKVILLKEIHHRVKNNFQVISSLLSLQTRNLDPKLTGVIEILRENQNRINSMALIHEKLYQAPDFTRIYFGEYISNMIRILYQSYGVSQQRIRFHMNIEHTPLGIDNAIPCGLIINEIISNSLTHAFPDESSGNIWIEMQHLPKGLIRLRVKDDGIGLPIKFNPKKSNTLGLYLIKMLTEYQLHGFIYLTSKQGTEIVIEFPKEYK